jgi:hypothetical protein
MRARRLRRRCVTKQELLDILKKCAEDLDPEVAHRDADGALLEYINDPEIEAAYRAITKWYAL